MSKVVLKRQRVEWVNFQMAKEIGMQLPGGITFNGQKIWEEANDLITKLEAEVINDYSLPVTDMIG